MSDFISTHDIEDLQGLSPRDFVEQYTGENFEKILKLIKISKKKQAIEQDFV